MQELQSGEGIEKKGYEKIKRCCEVAAADGFYYVWIDTCCIDKTSSAELSEAINSMYQWYQDAETCYAYLADVFLEMQPRDLTYAFERSRWFTRGWTLQELIAPSTIIFFDASWHDIGTKVSLLAKISDITGINIGALSNANLEHFSVAQRMSWASKRKTTRVEDAAYCLMGIFGINMPMLYGEGLRAFVRLQEEIMRISDDHSIFAWAKVFGTRPRPWAGLLAQSPFDFCESGKIVRSMSSDTPPFTKTNKGIHLQLPLKALDSSEYDDSRVFLAVLDCQYNDDPENLLCIRVRDTYSGTFKREHTEMDVRNYRSEGLAKINWQERENLAKVSMYVDEGAEHLARFYDGKYSEYFVDAKGLERHNVHLRDVYPLQWIEVGRRTGNLHISESHGSIGILKFTSSDNSGDSVFVALRQERHTLMVSIDTQHPEGEIKDMFNLFASRTLAEPMEGLTDRAYMQYPGKPWCISIVVKRRIIGGERRVIAYIDKSDQMPAFQVLLGHEGMETCNNV